MCGEWVTVIFGATEAAKNLVSVLLLFLDLRFFDFLLRYSTAQYPLPVFRPPVVRGMTVFDSCPGSGGFACKSGFRRRHYLWGWTFQICVRPARWPGWSSYHTGREHRCMFRSSRWLQVKEGHIRTRTWEKGREERAGMHAFFFFFIGWNGSEGVLQTTMWAVSSRIKLKKNFLAIAAEETRPSREKKKQKTTEVKKKKNFTPRVLVSP